MNITKTKVKKILKAVDAGLIGGSKGEPVLGKMCVESAVCYGLGLPHSDEPVCVHPALRKLKIQLNDAVWSSDQARAAGLRRLAVLQLGTNENFNAVLFAEKLAIMTVNKILPEMLKSVSADAKVIEDCQNAKTLEQAKWAAKWAKSAAESAESAAESAAEWAAEWAAESAKWAAKWAAKPDKVLLIFAKEVEKILIEMKVIGVQWLSLCGE